MTEKPILFNAEMVRAVLDGGKTQTRRIVKGCIPIGSENSPILFDRCPYGKISDQLWVRETCKAEELPNGLDGVRYLADNKFIEIANTGEASIDWLILKTYGKNKHHDKTLIGPTVPSIHMPRWASRIQLEITNIRAQRLQDISEADALAEGINCYPFYPDDGFPLCSGYTHLKNDGKCILSPTAKYAYKKLWQSINGAESWEANPWVWVIEFKKINP